MACHRWRTGRQERPCTHQTGSTESSPHELAEDLYKVARKQDRTGDAIMPVIQARSFFGIRSMDCLVLAYT